MPLSQEELLELQELEELAQLEAEVGDSAQQQDESSGLADKAAAAVTGFGDTALMGYLPQAAGAVGAGVDKLTQGLGSLGIGPEADISKLEDEGFKVVQPEQNYLSARDQAIRTQQELEAKEPGASTAGKLAGIGASMATPLGGPVKSFMGALGRGAATGAAYNPGDEQGKIQPLQLGERAKQAALGGAVGGGMGALAKAPRYMADVNKTVGRIKKGTLGKYLKGELDAARRGMSEKTIAPLGKQLKEAVKKISKDGVEINPDRLKNISPGMDRLAQAMQKNTSATGRKALSGDKALRLKRAVGKRAEFKPSDLYNPQSEAKKQTAGKAYDILKNQIRKASPETADIDKKLQEAINIRDTFKKVKNPIQLFKGTKPGQGGADKYEILKQLGDKSGKDLGRVSDITTAASNQMLDPTRLSHPLEILKEFVRYGKRGMGAVSRPVAPISTPVGKYGADPLVKALLEGNKLKNTK